ncbi:MAG: molybdenum cofactor guanylyltransferase [Halobacteriales archaeon]|nr:molybdenum cofactor guanylyltransferase [Halobacteriales archaeon]
MGENDTVGIVLAGGESRRFGGDDKALAELDGSPLVERAVSAAAKATEAEPVVAVRDEEGRETVRKVLETDARFVFDSEGYEGPLAGLDAGIREVEASRVFVCGCDMPLVEPEVVRSFLDALRDGFDAVVPVDNGVLDPLHSALRRSAVVEALDDAEPDDGVYDILNRLDAKTVEKTGAVERSTTNVNTRAELEDLRRRSSRRP